MPIHRAHLRRDMSVRARERIFMEFERWGFDERGWLPNTRDKYYRTVVIADHWLQQNRGRSLLWATTRDMKAWLFSTTPDPRSRNNRRQALVAFGAFMLAQEMGSPRTERGVDLPLSLQLEPAPVQNHRPGDREEGGAGCRDRGAVSPHPSAYLGNDASRGYQRPTNGSRIPGTLFPSRHGNLHADPSYPS